MHRAEPLLHVNNVSSTADVPLPETGRVVGKNAKRPGCTNVLFALAFLANIVAVLFFFFSWVGDGCPGWPDGSHVQDALTDNSNQTWALVEASVQTGSLSLLFALVWVFLFLAIMKVAALTLIVLTYAAAIVASAGLGSLALRDAMECKERSPACGDEEHALAYAAGVGLLACAATVLLWLACVRKRLAFTAKLFSAVSGVLATCPGTVLVAFLFAAITVAWYCAWGGALLKLTLLLAGGAHESVPVGHWVWMALGLCVSLFWGHKVFVNVAHMTSCHVIASWYFDPDSAEGVPCCKPVTMVGLKRACTNYLGSSEGGSRGPQTPTPPALPAVSRRL